MRSFINRITPRHIAVLLILVSIAISIQCYLASKPHELTRYNNYVIFTKSFSHLIHNENLYVLYNTESYDLYKYSPTFTMLMGAFYYIPDMPGLILFNLLNICLFLYALFKLKLPQGKLKWMLMFLLVEAG